ncbi:acylneuraminate cytidylyltransferase family protein [Virgibacillus halodenitrificans]|uniref:acylneuraminate cytidylyltransferase family protein n=1 Tax=Virgibacillus halodenitrificans TaxID=1482 RepID=UPI001F2CBC2A|nr:acylneuraminate cytidylyltransferase family protein [Virgibacillus halodenitrificans]
MYNGKKILAIIPARSGSKGLKDKNIKELNGKPIIAYTIEAAIESGVFTDIIVSTDSEKYADIAKAHGAKVPFLRPDDLATDCATSTDMISYTLGELQEQGQAYDYFMLLQPTSPLRGAKDIVNAVSALFEKKANAIVSVCEAEHSPLLTNTLDDSLRMDDFLKNEFNKRRQDLPNFYRLNGAIYLSCTDYFLKYQNFYKECCFAYVMSQENSLDVDTMIDFKLVQVLMEDRD